MSVVVHSILRPHTGKNAGAESRARLAAGIYARHGAAVKVSRMVAGPFAGCIVLVRGYADFVSAAATFAKVSNDPSWADFERERAVNPMADPVVLRDISRRVFGTGSWDTHPVTHLRMYEVSRDKLADALALMPEAAELMKSSDVNVAALVPITGENLSTLQISYQCRSLEHWGEVLDGVGTSEAFQALVAKAGAIGTVRAAGVMVPV